MKPRLLQQSLKTHKQSIYQNESDLEILKLSNHANISNTQKYLAMSNNYLESSSKRQSRQKQIFGSRALQNSRKKISLRKASELFNSSVRSSSSKISKRNEIMQFDNIKWISIISAYDPQRLKNVNLSKQSCQKFLQKQGLNLKTDSRSKLYFTDLIKNYKSWLNKIHLQYSYIMQKFLHSKRSVNVTLVDLRPKLDEVIQQTNKMQQNVDQCVKNYQNHQFRSLLRKFQKQLSNSIKIQQIMQLVDKSKIKINNLFKKFDNQKKIQSKLNKVKNQGIHEIKNSWINKILIT